MYEELHLISFDMQLILPKICIDLSVKFMLKVDFWIKSIYLKHWILLTATSDNMFKQITCLPVVVVSGWLTSAWDSILWYNMLCSEPHVRPFPLINIFVFYWGLYFDSVSLSLSLSESDVLLESSICEMGAAVKGLKLAVFFRH